MASREEIEMSTKLILGSKDRDRYEDILQMILNTTNRGQRRAIEKERNHIEELAKTARVVEAAKARKARRLAGESTLGDTIRRLFGGR